jgi:hypothetical protein
MKIAKKTPEDDAVVRPLRLGRRLSAMKNATYLLEMADHLLRLAKSARNNDAGREEIGSALEALANELMATAVEIDTIRDRAANAR